MFEKIVNPLRVGKCKIVIRVTLLGFFRRDNVAEEVVVYSKLFLSVSLMLFASILWAGEAAKVTLAIGDVSVAGHSVSQGDSVNEGDLLATGRDGYLYLKTIDNGFFILRPNSAGQIITYHVYVSNPADSSIKLELKRGVARQISGDAVKSARHNFRFNTPVAAIGVRGTDFSVFSDQDTTRIVVLSGGVVVSPFSEACTMNGHGPCEGPTSKELFADKAGQMLQVGRGQSPVLLRSNEQSPDVVSPPRMDEPASKPGNTRGVTQSGSAVTMQEVNLDPVKASVIDQAVGQVVVPVPPAPPTPIETPKIIWGRWQSVLGQDKEFDVSELVKNNRLIATNAYYALLRSKESEWQRPEQNTIGFSLGGSQAAVLNEKTQTVSLASVENGKLQLDFANSTFSTQFDLLSQNERFKLQSKGMVSADGILSGESQFLRPTNMAVQGVLNNDNSSAAYLFRSRLDERRVASGVTFWQK